MKSTFQPLPSYLLKHIRIRHLKECRLSNHFSNIKQDRIMKTHRIPRKIKKGLKIALSAKFPLWNPKEFTIASIGKKRPYHKNTVSFKGYIPTCYRH